MSTDERRALAIILTLILSAAAARWLERPRPLLDDVAAVDLERLESESHAAKAGGPESPANKRDRPPATPRSAPAPKQKLDLNSATMQQIDSLPGVGPTVAARIIEQRATKPFRTLSDLRTVRGVGPALVARLAPFVLLTADPPQSADPQGIPSAPATEQPSGPIDLNRATASELEKLPGVGPALAARLVAWRDSAGRFRSWEDVDRVSGVGPALLARLKLASRF